MSTLDPIEIFLVTAPGLEPLLAAEARELGLDVIGTLSGGVTLRGGWPEVWRANLHLRGATRVLARIGAFRAMHPAQLDKRARKFPWAELLPRGAAIRVEASCRKSRIYHAGAAAQRVEGALRDGIGATIDKGAALVLKVRIEDDLCTFSLDTSGASLHKRGHKQAVNKAPMRETLAALFLRSMGYDGSQTVYDPMCGSGTFVIEAAEIAAGLAAGRAREFSFEDLPGFDADAFAAMKAAPAVPRSDARAYGSDRDAGAIAMSRDNAARAGVADRVAFTTAPVSDMTPPDGPPGIVIANAPYGGRIGKKRPLYGLYGAFGARLKAHFAGWRVGLITTEGGFAKATGLPFDPPGPVVDHGGIRIRLWQAAL